MKKTSRLYLKQMMTMQRFYFSILNGFSFNILNFTRRLFLKEKGWRISLYNKSVRLSLWFLLLRMHVHGHRF